MDTLFTRRNVLKAGAAAGLVNVLPVGGLAQEKGASADLILTNGRFATLDKRKSVATAVAISGGKFVAVGDEADVMVHKGDKTQVIDLKNRTVIFGQLGRARMARVSPATTHGCRCTGL